ncbi:hypothetical protein HS125_20870 [bacterium]|nr:hypothetical protein [bacterium]
MDWPGLARTVFSFLNRNKHNQHPEYRLLPPVVEYRSLVREGLDGFVIEEPVVGDDPELFAPPADCAPLPRPRLERREIQGRLLSLRAKGSDPLALGDLFQNPQELLLGLRYFIDEEIAPHLAQIEYSPAVAQPEAPPSPLLVSRIGTARISNRNKERLTVAATVLLRYLPPAMQSRLEAALLRLVDAMEVHCPHPEGTRLESVDLENIRGVVAAIGRAPNRYWQVLTLLSSLRGMVSSVQRSLGAEMAEPLACAS